MLFTRPEHAREIFAGDPAIFHAGKGNAILGPIMGEHSLLLQDGAEHQRARKLLMPAFNGHALRGYGALVTEVARAEVARWHAGEEFRCARPDERADPRGDPARRLRGHRRGPARPAAPARQPRPSTSARRSCSAGAAAAAAVRSLEAAPSRTPTSSTSSSTPRSASVAPAPDLADRTDVLSRLILRADDGDGDALTDEELRDQLVTLLLAGHETTATALAWALYELGRDPALLARTRRGRRRRRRRLARGGPQGVDAAAPGHPDGGAHPDAARHHRRHRPARRRHRRARRSCVATPATDNHPDPERVPARALPRADPPANTWIPFGGGVRRCIGAGFSLMEGVAVLREVLTAYDVDGARRRTAPRSATSPACRAAAPGSGSPRADPARPETAARGLPGRVRRSPLVSTAVVPWRERLRAAADGRHPAARVARLPAALHRRHGVLPRRDGVLRRDPVPGLRR